MAPNFNLEQVQVEWVFRGGWTFELFQNDQQYGLPILNGMDPIIAVVDLATNDLDSQLSVIEVMDWAWDVIRQILRNGVHRVVIMKVMPRFKDGNIPCDLFNQKAAEYNQVMQTLLVNFDVHRNNPLRHRFKDVWWWETTKLKAPNLYKDDGLHLNHTGLKRYYENIKLALTLATQEYM